MTYATFDDIADLVAGLDAPALVAIDGLPVSGKSTLADFLCRRLELDAVYLDDFVLPQRLWPSDRQPAFPFGYIRYADFMAAVVSLATSGRTQFHPFDWANGDVADTPRTVVLDRPVLIEGVSSLHPDLCRYYALRVFVDSDRSTTFEAAAARGLGDWRAVWRQWFLTSVDRYFVSNPAERADVLVAGRGIGNSWLE